MSKKKLIPELRFPEFSENWDISSVSDICEVYRGSTFSKADMYKNGSEPCIHYGELFTKYNEIISDVYSKTNKSEGFKSKAGDILMPSSDVTPDGLAKASAIMLDDVILGGDMNILRPKKSYNSIFLSYLLNHSKKEIIKLVSGTTVKHIYPSQIITCQLPIVKNESEQQKIASCLSSLDEVIESHSQKLDLLKDHKKGLMQNLFPQKGEKVPKLRFKEFKDEWVEKNLGELIDLLSGYAFQSQYFSEQGQKLITPKNFTKEGYATFNDENTKYTTEISDDKYWCKEGDLLLLITDLTSTCELLGKPVLLKKQDGLVLLNQRIIKVIPQEKILLDFLLQFFLTDVYHSRIKSTATGSTVRHSSNKIILDTKILLPPTLAEQQKLASCLSALDELITSQVEKIEQLKLHKKGLMQGLFPKIES